MKQKTCLFSCKLYQLNVMFHGRLYGVFSSSLLLLKILFCELWIKTWLIIQIYTILIIFSDIIVISMFLQNVTLDYYCFIVYKQTQEHKGQHLRENRVEKLIPCLINIHGNSLTGSRCHLIFELGAVNVILTSMVKVFL